MNKYKITIITGEVNIGKTTSLQKWLSTKPYSEIIGFLTPKINAERAFLDIKTNEVFNMLGDEMQEEVFNIGQYTFSKKSFKIAENRILDKLESNPDLIVIDEIGKLELENQGFHELIQLLTKSSFPLILIVRKSLVEAVIDKYKLEKNKIQIIEVLSPNDSLLIS